MFTRWGDLVYRFRFAVIGVVGAAMLALGGFGFGLEDHLSSSGLDDPGSESAQAARIADSAWGRDHNSDIVVMYNAPEGKTIDDPEFSAKIIENLSGLQSKYPDAIGALVGTYWKVGNAPAVPSTFGSKDKKHAFALIALKGANDTETLRSFRATKDAFVVPGVDTEVSGLQGMAGTLNDTMANDVKRMELLAIPAVGVLLFFIFGGIVAAALPLIIGGLTILGANGIVMAFTHFTEVNSTVSAVVSMIGLGLAIDYGLFIVSRFREELAEGYDTRAAVRRSVMTAGRTVVFSATMIIASLGGILLFPQGFLRSIAYGTIATVSLAAITAITILPAMLAVLGPRVDMLGLKRFRKDKSADEIENSFWGNLTRWVMKHPLKIAIPITIGLLLLIIPVKDLAFGGINEKYLPPDNSTRLAIEHFDEVFPLRKTDPVQIIFVSQDTTAIGKAWKAANQAPGLVGPFDVPSSAPNDRTIFKTSATLVDSDNAEQTIEYLRAIEPPANVEMYVGGQGAIQMDSINALLERMPLMIAVVLLVTTLLMFLTFGSLVLPIKAAVMSALGLGSTLGILTWIFIDGHGSGILNFTPQPISAPVLMLIIAIIYGLSTDYEVFLLSRMVEARAQGASTTEAVRIGTAQTGRIITAAALILLVVTGAFAFSDMVMMQYIAYGMIAALFIDATVLRMLLVPAIMKLLGDDCWWAPKWMKRIQEKIGLGEPILDDERPQKGAVVDLVKTTPITDPPTMQMVSVPDAKLAKTPRRPRTVAEIEAEAPTQRIDKITESAEPARPRKPMSPDPTRPRASMLSGEPTRVLPVVQPGSAKPLGADDEPTQMLPAVQPDSPAPEPGNENRSGRGDSGMPMGSPKDGSNHGDTAAPGEPTAFRSGREETGATGDPAAFRSEHGETGATGDPTAFRSGRGDTGASGKSTAIRPDHGAVAPGDPAAGNRSDHQVFGAGSGTPAPGSNAGDDQSYPSSTPVDSARENHSGRAEFGVDGVIGGSGPADVAGPVDGVIGGLDLPDSRGNESAPRGSERVKPPAGYSPTTPRISTPGTPVGGEFPGDTPESRPSIVTPARPNTDTPRPVTPSPSIVNTPPPVTPPSGIVNTPPPVTPPPSIVHPPTPRPVSRPSDFPAGGTFNGFTPLPRTGEDESGRASQDAPEPQAPAADRISPTATEDAAREPDSRPQSFIPPQPDLTATPGAHRADAQQAAEPASDLPEFPDLPMRRPAPEERDAQPQTPAAQNVFGTPVPVDPQQLPWTDGVPGDAPTAEGAEPPMSAGASSMWASIDNARRSAQIGSPDNAQSAESRTPQDPAAREQTAAQSDTSRTPDVLRPQVAPPGFTPVSAPETTSPESRPADPVSPADDDPETAPFTAADEAGDQGATGGHATGESPRTAGGWQAPPGFTPIPNSDAAEPSSPPAPDTNGAASSENGSTATPEDDPQADTRTEIENWMAQLRSSRRGSTPVDEGRHHGDDGRTVSVNELLRRRNDETP
ncbi:MMPL family transporter [Nocardia ignorata]|uniref:RND superfamily putative drug exporter n=1 Tax=Nocardia ignorata TaxID=145285 RepID=A0A4R6PW29_NOCIG|nr:RND superfamily putative drug exporter [Nocardia ignorata]